MSVKHKSKLALFLTSMFIGCTFANNDDISSNNTEILISSITTFVAKDISTKYTLMSDHYRSIFRDTDNLATIFDKESYEIKKIEDVKAYIGKRTGSTLGYIKLKLKWKYEGYDGTQTCHFKLVKDGKRWDVDWILC